MNKIKYVNSCCILYVCSTVHVESKENLRNGINVRRKKKKKITSERKKKAKAKREKKKEKNQTRNVIWRSGNLDKSRDVLQEHAKLCECIRGTHTASRERSPDGGRGEATS